MAYQPKSYRKFVATAATATLVASAFAPFASAHSFKDVETKYNEAVDFLVSKGVSGYTDGTFKTQQTITRLEAAEMLGKALGLTEVKDAPASGFTDVPARVATLINAFKAKGITNGKTETTFGANDNITRGELAIWIQKAYDLKAKEGSSNKFSDVADRYKTAVQALVDNEITQGTTETTFGTTANAKRGDYALFIKRAVDAATPKVTTATKVENVSATNLKEVLVTFDGAVNVASAENLASYTLSDDSSSLGLKSAVVQADGKSVLLTLSDSSKLSNQEEHKLSVNNVKSKADTTKTVSVKDFTFKPVDSALPTLEKIEGLGNKAIKLTFSEPVQSTSTVADTFKLNGSVVSGVLTGTGTRTLILELFAPLDTTEHTLSINNKIKDYADYNFVGLDAKFTVVEDKVAPTVVEVKDVTLESATVVFSEDVKPAEAINGANYYWMNGTTKHYADGAVQQIDGKTYKLSFSGSSNKLPAVATDLYIENIVDYSANKIANATKVSINPVIDQTRPEVVSEVFNDSNELKFTFNKAVDLSTFKTSNVVLKDSTGKAVTSYGVTVSEGYTGSSKTVTLKFSSNLKAGTYTVELSGLKDTTTLQNTMMAYTTTVVAKDGFAPEAISVAGTGNVYYVTFDKAMDITTSASILNPENYYMAYTQSNNARVGKLPAGTNIVPVNGDKGVIITLPSSVTAVSELTIQGVKSAGGVYLDGFAKKFAGSDITASFKVDRSYATDKDTVYVKFNQPVARANKVNFSVNGSVASNAVVDSKDNTLVKLTLSSALASTDTAGVNVVVDGTGTGTQNLAGVQVQTSTTPVGDAIAPEVTKTDGKISLTSDIKVESDQETVTIKISEAVTSLNNSNLKDNFVVYQANGLVLEYGEDYEITSANLADLKAGTADTIVLTFTDSSYVGGIDIAFNNANGNIVDSSAVSTSTGNATTELAVKNFDTRDKSKTTGSLVIKANQQGVNSVAAAVAKTFNPTGSTNDVVLPVVASGYTIAVKSTATAAVYSATGAILTNGTSEVVYTVTHTASGVTADTAPVTVTVSGL